MNQVNILKAALLAASLVSLPAAFAANLSKADYEAGKSRISADFKTDKAACDSQTANAKDICMEEAKAKEKVAKSELEFGYTGKAADRTKLLEARAEAAYAVAKERCDDQAGNAKDVCVKEAKAAEVKAMADAKMGKEIAEAKKEAATDKMDANYKVAAEKCDAMAGDAKSACIAAAKAKFGQN